MRGNWLRWLVVWLFCWGTLVASWAQAQVQTHRTLPSSSSSVATWQNYLTGEFADRWLDQNWTPFVSSGGIHSTAAGVTSSAFATVAVGKAGGYITQSSAAITYDSSVGCAATDVAWVVVTEGTATSVGGNFTRVPGTHYAVDCVSTTQPTLPTGSAWLMAVTITGSVITRVEDLRQHWYSLNTDLASNEHALASPTAEVRAQMGGQMGSFIESGCTPSVPVSSLTIAAFACVGQILDTDGQLRYVNQSSLAVTLAGNAGTYWLALHTDVSSAVAGWTRVGISHYLWQKSATIPTRPTGGVIVSQITVDVTPVITTINNAVAPRSPGGPLKVVDGCGLYSSFNAAVSAIGSTPATLAVGCTMHLTGDVTTPSTLTIKRVGQGLLTALSAATLTVSGPWDVPDELFVDTNVTVKLPTIDTVRAHWFGTTGTAVQKAITTAQTTGATQGNASVLLGAGVFTVSTTITVSGSNHGISIVCAPYAALQQGSTRPISVLRWTGGASPMFDVQNTYTQFVNCGFENTGTGTNAVRFTTGGGRDLFDRVSMINGSGTTAWSDAAVRWDVGTVYTNIRNSEFTGPSTIIFKYFGTGTDLYFENNVFDGGTDYVALSMQASAVLDQVVIRNSTYNSQSGAEALIFDQSSIGAGTLNTFTLQNVEYDSSSSTAGDRGVKLKNTYSAVFLNNEIYCNGTMTAFASVTNSTVRVDGGHLRSLPGPMFEFLDTVSLFFPGHVTLDNNTQGLSDLTTTIGVVAVPYSTTPKLLGQSGNPGGHTLYEITPTDGVGFSIAFAKYGDSTWGFMTNGQLVTVRIKNTFGVLGTVTFANTHFKITGAAFTAPANGNSRSLTCVITGGYCVELYRSAGDVPN